MRNSIPFLVILVSALASLALPGTARSQEGFFSGIDPSVTTTPVDTTLSGQVGTALTAPGQSCTIIDFEGLVKVPDDIVTDFVVPVGTIVGSPNVIFGAGWFAGLDEDAQPGAIGNFANEPSPDTAATVLGLGVDEVINFDAGVQFIEVFYSAAAISLPMTLTAYDGPDASGNVVDTVEANTIGTSFDGANCVGDPTGDFCLWDVVTLTTTTNNIRSITLTGFIENQFGFDDMTYCTFGARINIKPGSDPNSINTCSGGTTAVTIWGSDTSPVLDVTTIDQSELILASAGVKTIGKLTDPKTQCSIEDVGSFDDNEPDNIGFPDGVPDLTCHFVTIALSSLDEISTTADLNIVGCDDPDNTTGDGNGCDASDAGFYEITATDAVNIVKDCGEAAF